MLINLKIIFLIFKMIFNLIIIVINYFLFYDFLIVLELFQNITLKKNTYSLKKFSK